jgi:FAD/FMN-containing dehydrogenase
MMFLSQVQVDSTGLARVGPGNKLKDVAEKLHAANGRYMPHGSSPTVGIGGHATVGGLGLHSRLEGTTLDALQEAEVVLANGTIVRASSGDNPDLFWAIRGAGASFGIVTEFTFQTKPEPKEVLNFAFTIASTDPASLSVSFKAYHQITNDAQLDRRFSAAVVVTKNQLQITGAFFGPQSDFDRIDLEPRIPGITQRSVVAGLSWMEHMNRTFDSISSSFPAQSYFTAQDTCITRSTLPTNTSIDNMFQHIQTTDAGSDNWFVLIDLYGGAVGDVAADATALPHRDMAYFFTPYAITDSPTNQTTRNFIQKAVLEIQGNEPDRYLSYAGYTSLPSGFVPQEKYWGPNLARLQRIKPVVDPDDVFSTPYGVKATGATRY